MRQVACANQHSRERRNYIQVGHRLGSLNRSSKRQATALSRFCDCMKPKKIICVVGTRPEGLKMAPVILELMRHSWAEVRILSTGQHRELLEQVLALFDIQPHLDLKLMQDNQSLAGLTAKLTEQLDGIFDTEMPDMVIVQGDTTTAFIAALCAFYRSIPCAHVEAGLRTGTRNSPFPEEMNRVFAGYLSDLHFAPTENARLNLISEGVPESDIYVTGNTVIDALLMQASRSHQAGILKKIPDHQRLILVTAHRRESFGEPFAEVCRALRHLIDTREDVHIVYPVHPNPNVSGLARTALGMHPQATLCEPLDYADFISTMQSAHILITDSGGVQEEAPALGKPVLVLRNETERPEAVEAGVVELVGTSFEQIINRTNRLLDDREAYASMARGLSPYGDGHAAARIVRIIGGYFDAK